MKLVDSTIESCFIKNTRYLFFEIVGQGLFARTIFIYFLGGVVDKIGMGSEFRRLKASLSCECIICSDIKYDVCGFSLAM